jgi:hypothetical protein
MSLSVTKAVWQWSGARLVSTGKRRWQSFACTYHPRQWSFPYVRVSKLRYLDAKSKAGCGSESM